MRKWMSDRLKRSKKKTDEAKAEPGPAPLQPAYFEAGSAPEAHSSAAQESSREEPSPPNKPPSRRTTPMILRTPLLLQRRAMTLAVLRAAVAAGEAGAAVVLDRVHPRRLLQTKQRR